MKNHQKEINQDPQADQGEEMSIYIYIYNIIELNLAKTKLRMMKIYKLILNFIYYKKQAQVIEKKRFINRQEKSQKKVSYQIQIKIEISISKEK